MIEDIDSPHATANEPPQPEEQEDSDEPNGERGRSTIKFPYAGLADAERIAHELHKSFGGAAAPEGIAKVLGQKPGSGAFRQKLSAARIFGLATTSPGRVSLTRLGRAVIDPEKQAEARAEAFLNVELYKAIFDKYDGDLLPPPDTLESEFVALGVSAKQAPLARQIMFRSAERAGFSARGANKLVRPDGQAGAPRPRDPGNEQPHHDTARTLPAAIEAPVLAMLETGESWNPQQTHDYVDGLRKMHRALKGA